MAACAGNAEPARATDDASARSSDPTTAPSQPNISTAQPVAYRLSTRNQRAPCNACKAHAAHRYFASAEVAVASRAHPGCTCTVVANPVSGGQLETWFATTGKVTFDDRWGG